ncbi:MAG: DNA-directed RNA polymerase subunit B'', partial [Methanobacterium sp.]
MGKNAWGLVDAFFDQYNLVDHHIKSYNDFVNHRIQDIINITEDIVLEQGEYRVTTGKLKIEKPFIKEADGSRSEIYPTEARLRNLTYSAHMYLEMALVREGEEDPTLEHV